MTSPERVRVAGADFDRLTQAELIERVTAAITDGRGGTIVTPNIDICHRIGKDPVSREYVTSASLVVPDGMPLLWAARLAGQPLVERITGADLIFALSDAACAGNWPIYLIGGLPGENGQPAAAELAARRLAASRPGLLVGGFHVPPARFDPLTADLDELVADLARTGARIVFVGLGFPKQEQLISRLAPGLPGSWFVGCGAAIPYAAGELRRAPGWMQRSGLEWLFRLLSEPRRLASRYLGRDLPYALTLLATSPLHRRRPTLEQPPASGQAPAPD
jgi:N-acetylglucosaminyldiphosphoundecaprenol N-acetyl-beta-D-mannosaminyltransferase